MVETKEWAAFPEGKIKKKKLICLAQTWKRLDLLLNCTVQFLQVLQQQWLMNKLCGGTKLWLVIHSHSWITVDLLSEYLKIVCCIQKSSILTRAGEQRKRSQSMKSYPSSELRNMCDEHIATEEPPEKEDLLQQMLERRWGPGRHKCTETGFFHTLRCVVKNVLYVSESSADIHVLEVVCQVWGASAVSHLWPSPRQVGYVQLLTFTSSTYIFPWEDEVPGKISVEINVLWSAKMWELWKAHLSQLVPGYWSHLSGNWAESPGLCCCYFQVEAQSSELFSTAVIVTFMNGILTLIFCQMLQLSNLALKIALIANDL